MLSVKVTVRRKNRHKGAKAIYEFLRYETDAEDVEVTFKLNNSYVSGLARLYNAVTRSDYFEVRDTAQAA